MQVDRSQASTVSPYGCAFAQVLVRPSMTSGVIHGIYSRTYPWLTRESTSSALPNYCARHAFSHLTRHCQAWWILITRNHSGSSSTLALTYRSGSCAGLLEHRTDRDHGESAGAFQVVSGTLLEQTSSGYRLQFRTLVAGEGRSFEQNHIHHLGNVRMGTALSVHVYTPRLTTTTRYAITPTGLKSGAVDLNGLGW